MLSKLAIAVALVLALSVPVLGDYYVHFFALVLINVMLAARMTLVRTSANTCT